jgi:phage terminase large subunit-like protein
VSLSGLRINEGALARLSPEERKVAEEGLLALAEARKRNPLLGYEPHAKQSEFHRSRPDGSWPRSRLYIGGNRAGKTTGTHVDTIVQCVDPDVVPEHLRAFKKWDPPFYCRIVGPDLTRWLEGIALQKFREWCPKDQLVGGGFSRGFEKQQVMLRFKNGSWVQFMSNDQDLDKFAGAALHRVVYDESPRQDIRRECLMRLIDYGGEEIYGLTPMDGMSNWIYDEFFEPWERDRLDPSARVVLVDMDDNPHLSSEDKEWALSGLSSEEREARKTGRFVSFAGLIYPQFSTTDHVIPQIDRVPPGVEVFRGIDPGYRHMCAVLYAYLDADDDLVVFDEIALQGRTVAQVCAEIKLRDLRWGAETDRGVVPLTPRWTVIDPASRNKNSQTGRSDQQEFHDNGVVTIPGQNAVTAGINRVKERLDAGKLKVCANCEELRGEFKRYRWTKATARSEDAARERPVKADDHAVDVLRYICMQRPLAPDRDRPRPNETQKDRLLRAAMQRLSRPRGVAHPAGSGIFT